MVPEVRPEIVEAQHHVAESAGTIRDVEFRDGGTEVGDLRGEAVGVRQREQVDGPSIRQPAEAGHVDRHRDSLSSTRLNGVVSISLPFLTLPRTPE